MADFDLPDDVVALLKEHDRLNADRLAALGVALAARRTEAVNARKESGIEDIWAASEEAYLGIDNANRGDFAKAKWAKPTSLAGPVTTDATKAGQGEVKSSAYVRLTTRYVEAGAAKLGEIALPVDDKAFSFDATPVPELIEGKNDLTQVKSPTTGLPLERPARANEVPAQQPGAVLPPPGGAPVALPAAAAPAAPGSPPSMVPLTVKDLAEEAMDRAQASAKLAEKRIYDWMVEARYPAEMRKVIFDGARIGVGVLKGPFPDRRTAQAVKKVDGKTVPVSQSKIVPSYEWRDPWNIFPDRACGENIHNGSYLFDRDFYSEKQLKELKAMKGYIAAAIDKVILEGPASVSETSNGTAKAEQKEHRFTVWFYYGIIKREDLVAAGGISDEDEAGKDECYGLVTMVNDTVIRATLNPLDSGKFPYHSFPWQRRAGHWAGVGIGEQLTVPQRMINAATRAMLNNAGKSAGSIIVLDRSSVTPANNSWEMTPDKLFFKASDATIDDVRKAFATFQVPNQGPALMAIIEYAMRLAEESTSIPLVTQGQSGPTTPETFGATQLQNNNANQLLRSIGYGLDDYITEPVVIQSYEYLLLDPDVPEEEKGDWHINAHGTSAFVERAIQDQTIQSMAAFVKDPAFGTNPKKWFAEYMRTKHLNPKQFQYTKEEQAKIDAMPQPAAPAIEVAKIKSADADKKLAATTAADQASAQTAENVAHIRGEVALQVAELKKAVDEMRVQRDVDRDTKYVQAEDQRTTNEYNARMEELKLKERLAILEYANKKELKIDDVKKELAKTAMTLAVQKDLAEAAQVAESAAEPTGKAPKGEGFTK